ncbi:unnamed protein product [Notodromas monacha]|uniref:Solute carrier family 12 member 6 n=1 Tax=Notodromas monacha TaxID=399045 RepID=A0A7R9BGF9_9CRUS|nr:unnamed protein product [Notodromas monacha]CAG0914294.1 unnamed protein product [Notodromas monacha]
MESNTTTTTATTGTGKSLRASRVSEMVLDEHLYKEKRRVPAAPYILNWGASPTNSGIIAAGPDPYPHHVRASRRSRLQQEQKSNAEQKKLGTLNGVFLPCVQNIFGVILFIRLAWIVGVAGWLQAGLIVLLCSGATLLTAVSLSAVTTNGAIPAGGPYYIISRGLGPQVGGAVGILFYLGTTIAGAMYVCGAIEILFVYIAPAQMSQLIPDKLTATRVYGTILLFLITLVVFVGMKHVVLTAIPIQLCVVLSIIAVYVGLLVKEPSEFMDVRMVGKRLVSRNMFDSVGRSKNSSSMLDSYFCHAGPDQASRICNPYYAKEGISQVPALSTTWPNGWYQNLHPKWTEQPGDYVATWTRSHVDVGNFGNDPGHVFVQADMATDFVVLVGIFFPSVTGIMAGCNRSGDLRDPSKSIPFGTITAILLTSSVYMSWVLLLAGRVSSVVLNDKFGRSLGSQLLVALLAWPSVWVVLIGALCSTIGAGLQSLVGAPRLLAAIAHDDVVPKLGRLVRSGSARGPLLVTWFVCQVTVLIGNVDDITPLVSACFLMCYLSVNASCALQSLLRVPSWRPRFRMYHWTLSLFGACLCLTVMLMCSWLYTLLAFSLALAISRLISYRVAGLLSAGQDVEWVASRSSKAILPFSSTAAFTAVTLAATLAAVDGNGGIALDDLEATLWKECQLWAGDGLAGLSLASARAALLRQEGRPVHPKNWTPTILTLLPSAEAAEGKEKLFGLLRALTLRTGGVTIVATVVESPDQVPDATDKLRKFMRHGGTKPMSGFVRVVASCQPSEALKVLVQSVGIASLSPNTVAVSMPATTDSDDSSARFWPHCVEAIRAAISCGKAVMLVKGLDEPSSSRTLMSGDEQDSGQQHHQVLSSNTADDECAESVTTIDVWWIFNDGGILLLLPYLLLQQEQREDDRESIRIKRKRKRQELRIFTIARPQDNSIAMKRHLQAFLYELRIPADVFVVEMDETDVSAYAVERTLALQQRRDLLSQLHLHARCDVMAVLDHARTRDCCPPVSDKPEENNKKDESEDEHELQVRRMHTALKLNGVASSFSRNARLVFMNLPSGPGEHESADAYLGMLQALTDGLPRVILVYGTGTEVVTLYS